MTKHSDALHDHICVRITILFEIDSQRDSENECMHIFEYSIYTFIREEKFINYVYNMFNNMIPYRKAIEKN